jgi:hypothetical protein
VPSTGLGHGTMTGVNAVANHTAVACLRDLLKHLRGHGLPSMPGRPAALRRLLLSTPRRGVVAGLLGHTGDHLAQLAVRAGAGWSLCTADDHGPAVPAQTPARKVTSGCLRAVDNMQVIACIIVA